MRTRRRSRRKCRSRSILSTAADSRAEADAVVAVGAEALADVAVLAAVSAKEPLVVVAVSVAEAPKAVSVAAVAAAEDREDLEAAKAVSAAAKVRSKEEAAVAVVEVEAVDDATFRTKWTKKVFRNCRARPQLRCGDEKRIEKTMVNIFFFDLCDYGEDGRLWNL